METAPNVDYGDGITARSNEILRTVVGSGVHGIAIEGTDDHDEMGIFIEPLAHALGVDGPYDQHVWRTQPEGVCSGPGDIDLTVYSLRKYMRLAIAGNPTVLVPLFAPETDIIVRRPLGMELRALVPSIVSQAAGRRFLGYLDAQYERMLGGGRRSRVPHRPALVKQHGFDVKYASHAMRLSLQGIELMETGHLSLPLRPDERELCRRVKIGAVGLGEVKATIRANRDRLAALIDEGRSPLPEEPDYKRVNAWMIHAHLKHWWK